MRLQQKREVEWVQPYLPRVLVFQANVVAPLSATFNRASDTDSVLRFYGVPLDEAAPEKFGLEEALGYKQLLEMVPIDRLWVVTIGTMNKDERQVLLSDRVDELAKSIDQVFGTAGHVSKLDLVGTRCVDIANPPGSYWRDARGKQRTSVPYYVAVNCLMNARLKDDEDWKNILHEDNLMLAWARARANMLSEALCDEVEIRIFEDALRQNICRLRECLLAYRSEVLPTDDQIQYDRPKNATSLRPYALTRLEEEIVSVALIQRMETIVGASSYAYRVRQSPGERSTEKLYSSWFSVHREYMADARSVASRYLETGVVVQADVAAFYEVVIQKRMVALAERESRTDSERVRWLIRRLISKSLLGHEEGRGLSQGAIGSGFFANAYLAPVDARFGTANPWGVRYFRYVDDMTLVLPTREHLEAVMSALSQSLAEIGLELNSKKTKIYSNVEDFLRDTDVDGALDSIQADVYSLTDPLWVLDPRRREMFVAAYHGSTDEWWSLVASYELHLRAIGVYVARPELSRKIVEFLFSARARKRCLTGRSELPMPVLSSEPTFVDDAWVRLMQPWAEEAEALRGRLVRLFVDSVEALDRANLDRRLQRRVRFAGRRLVLLGLQSVACVVADVLCHEPWLLGEPRAFVDGLGRCECYAALEQILDRYHQRAPDAGSQYMRAVAIRAIRFMPHVAPETFGSVLSCATGVGASTVEKLAATETMIAVVERVDMSREGHEAYQRMIAEALDAEVRKTDDVRSNRLVKNYMFILGEALPEAILHEPAVQGDYMLRDAYEMVRRGRSAQAMLAEHEPNVLRFEYYGGAEGGKSYDDVF